MTPVRPSSPQERRPETARACCARRRAVGRRGFTFVELCIGMVVTSMVMGALAAFALAMSSQWHAAGAGDSLVLSMNQLNARVQARLIDAKRIGAWRPGAAGAPAALLAWRADLDGDGQMQYAELFVLQFNPTTKTLDLYTPVVPGGGPNPTWSTTDLLGASAISTFTTGLTPTPLARRVSDCSLLVEGSTSTTIAPRTEWTITLTDMSGGTSFRETCVTSLRAPASPL